MCRSMKSGLRAARFSVRTLKRCDAGPRLCSALAAAVRRAVFRKVAGGSALGLEHPLASYLNSFRQLRRMRRVDSAVALAVAKVKDKADDQPADQAQPICPAEAVDHQAAGDDPENRDEGRRRNAKPSFQPWIFHAHDPDAGADENEC